MKWYIFTNVNDGVRKTASEENCPLVRVRVWFRISVRIRARGQFSLGAIFLEPWTRNSCEKELKGKSVRKTNTRTCLTCSAWLLAYLKLSKKWLDHGLAPRILSFIYFYFAQLAQKQFFTDVSKNTSL